jgi:hypothetical protein
MSPESKTPKTSPAVDPEGAYSKRRKEVDPTAQIADSAYAGEESKRRKDVDPTPVDDYDARYPEESKRIAGSSVKEATDITPQTEASSPEWYEALRVRARHDLATLALAGVTILALAEGVAMASQASANSLPNHPDSAITAVPGIGFTTIERSPTETFTESIEIGADNQLMEWARQFDVDPAAVEPRGPDSIAGAAEQIQQLQSEGWSIDRITVQGFASDEGDDRGPDHNPGFGMPTNEKNIKLANKRATTVDSLFKQQLESELGTDQAKGVVDKMQSVQGEEVRDDELADDIEAEAARLGVHTDDLVMQFNRDPSSLSAETRKVLEGLRQDRYVKITIEASREGAISEERVKTVFIPIPLPMPAPIPVADVPRPPTVPQPKPSYAPQPDYKVREQYVPVAHHQKQPRPFNNSQRGTRHMGQRGNRMTRSHGGNAH